MSRAQEWRLVAGSFHRIAYHVEKGDLARLSERVPLSDAEKGVVSFCLHIWSHSDHTFDLTETQRWDEEHLAAFGGWVTNPDEPCRYF